MEVEQGSIPAFLVIFIVVMIGLIGMIMLSAAFEAQYSPLTMNGSYEQEIVSSDLLNTTYNVTSTGTTVVTTYLWVFILFAIIAILGFLYAYLR
ncbi:MAG: hypothetical protein PHR28_04430 [candidate division Zixibacteria bacterium]|jgi:uncharacterized membrane protein YccF (DUF307 family)|nr:hypothetical protein [candidate division Zixibacteria bacterium]